MRIHQTPPTATSVPGPSGVGVFAAEYVNDDTRLWYWMAVSLLAHASVVLSIWLVITILSFFGLIPRFDDLMMKPRDVEFVLVDDAPSQPPKNPTNLRAEKSTRSGGEKTVERNPGVPQQAAGAPNPRAAQPAPQAQPQPQPQPRPQPQPQPQPRAAQPQPQPQPQPKPTPRPPAPKVPSPTQATTQRPALPPNPIAPTIKRPAPPNPAASAMSGPVARTSGATAGGSSQGGSPASGSPGPSMIGGTPTRSGGGAAAGGGGAGGTGAFSQGGSPGGGGGRPGVDAMAEPDFGPYIAELQRRIRRNWSPPVEDQSKRVVAVFTISRQGRLMDLRIQQSSGSPQADQAALAAVRASAPFRELPANFRRDSIDVQFVFDYEIAGRGQATMPRR